MMSYQRERDETITLLSAEGMPLAMIRRLLSVGQTLHRLAVAQCNGDWPADNGERKTTVCPICELNWHPSSLKTSASLDAQFQPATLGNRQVRQRYCPDCRTTRAVVELCKDTPYQPVFAGDPRGCVLKVVVPSGRTNDGGREGICIPVRER